MGERVVESRRSQVRTVNETQELWKLLILVILAILVMLASKWTPTPKEFTPSFIKTILNEL